MQAFYDLSRYPANFNFVEFLVAASTLGADHIVLDDSQGYKAKFPKVETGHRVASILEPACALAGCTHEFGRKKGIDPGYHISAVLRVFKEKGELKKLKTVLPPKTEKYTVTIRNSSRYKERNSNAEAWRKFASEIGALVIEDYADKSIHLHERMALYAGAEMNYLVANGPIGLLMFSDYPYTAFMKNVNPAYHQEHGWPVGTQLPWANGKQLFVWANDDYENIRRHAYQGQAREVQASA
jgi:hypothetical protein